MNKVAQSHDIRGYLLRQDKEELVRLVLEAASRDDAFLNRLLVRIANAETGRPNIQALRGAIDYAAEVNDYIDYRGAWAYADKLNHVVSSFRSLLTSGHAAEVIELVEYAIEVIERQIEYVDDSNGEVGGVLADLEQLHFDAYSQFPLTPKQLGERLFDTELKSEYTFFDAINSYADVLGEEGIEAYAAKARLAWKQLPKLGPGDESSGGYGSRQIARIMEAVARRTSDIDAYVSVVSKDLSHASRFATIVEVYQLAGDDDKALEWAERGFRSFPDVFRSRLSDQLVSIYRNKGQHAEALDILWHRFEARPAMALLQPIKDYTEVLGQWPEWHSRALTLMRKQVDAPRHDPYSSARSELIRVLLWDGDTEGAWMEANKGDRLSHEIWLAVANAREETNPQESIEVYRKIMNQLVENTSNGDYEMPVELLRKMRRLFRILGHHTALQAEADRLRGEFKRKRNFMRDLDAFMKEG